jgi:uncharacterized OsmC-like protein
MESHMASSRVDIRQLQTPIRERYKSDPASAPMVLRVTGGTSDLADPLHCDVKPESVPSVTWRSGAHEAVGGDGEAPCSGDLLLGALVACQEITLRMVAANMSIAIEKLEITAEADWDPRGTLAMGKEFPVGITAIRCHTKVTVAGDERGERAERLLKSAEKYCVVLNTLREGVAVESTFALATT